MFYIYADVVRIVFPRRTMRGPVAGDNSDHVVLDQRLLAPTEVDSKSSACGIHDVIDVAHLIPPKDDPAKNVRRNNRSVQLYPLRINSRRLISTNRLDHIVFYQENPCLPPSRRFRPSGRAADWHWSGGRGCQALLFAFFLCAMNPCRIEGGDAIG
jgi:hypothetical protein